MPSWTSVTMWFPRLVLLGELSRVLYPESAPVSDPDSVDMVDVEESRLWGVGLWTTTLLLLWPMMPGENEQVCTMGNVDTGAKVQYD